jgi:hypothetical protein
MFDGLRNIGFDDSVLGRLDGHWNRLNNKNYLH